MGDHVDQGGKLLLQTVEILQRDDELALGRARPHQHHLAHPTHGPFKPSDGLAQTGRERIEKRGNVLAGATGGLSRPCRRGGRGRQLCGRGSLHESFPMTCSIFSRRICAVNGLMR
jgi:hypothetical protein